MRYISLPLTFFLLVSCTAKNDKPTSGFLALERQYFSQQQPDSLVNSFTRKLFFNENYSFLTVADSAATADDHLYIRDYAANKVYLKKTFDDVNYYASFPLRKEEGIHYTGKSKKIHGYLCKEGIYVSEMRDTTTFYATEEIGLDRTIWSLADPKGFVLEAKHQNGIKKVVKDIHWEPIDDSFFKAHIDTLKTYHKKSYYELKIVEAIWELNYFKDRLEMYRKMKEEGEITSIQLNEIENSFASWFKDIEARIKELEKKNNN